MSLLTSCVALNDKEEMRRDAVDSSEGSVLSLGSGHNLYLKRDRKKAGTARDLMCFILAFQPAPVV